MLERVDILVAYTMRPRSDVNELLGLAPEDSKEIKAFNMQRRRECSEVPYLGALESARVSDMQTGDTWSLESTDDDGLIGPAIAEALGSVARKRSQRSRKSALDKPLPKVPEKLTLCGFNLQLFRSMIMTECAESNHLELAGFVAKHVQVHELSNLIMPVKHELLDYDIVIKRLGIILPEEMSYEPGDDPALDLDVAEQVYSKFGLI